MLTNGKLVHLALGLVMAMSIAGSLSARADDSSADVAQGFEKAMQKSHGAVLRVPVNELGQENTGAAEIRIYSGDTAVSATSDLESVWSKAVASTPQTRVSTSDVNGDSSTWGWYNWPNYGWQYPGCFNNYYPSYYFGGSYYQYGYGFGYGYYSPYFSYGLGYNYYYYPGCYY